GPGGRPGGPPGGRPGGGPGVRPHGTDRHPDGRGQDHHARQSPDDPISAYLAGREQARAGGGIKARFIAPFGTPGNAATDLEAFLAAVSEVFPVQESRRGRLKQDVLSLWRDLTSERSLREADYIRKASSMTAYVRYFMAWNVVRLVPVLAGLPLNLPQGAVVLDIGSGPLTLPIALWIARPDLRSRGLRLVCTDRVRKALESGSALLDALRLKTGGPILGDGAWNVELRRAVFPDMAGPVRADFITTANAFTEFFWSASGRREHTLGERAAALIRDLTASLKPGGSILLAEPGEPRSGAMLSALREAALLAGFLPESPCPHTRACPMPGSFGGMGDRKEGKARSALPPVHQPRWRPKMPWCHFPVPLTSAPPALARFSEEVGLPKERLTVSWLGLRMPPSGDGIPQGEQKGLLRTRLVSDPIRLPGGWDGRYACSDLGYTLVVGAAAQERAGSLLDLDRPARVERDVKSGAVLAGP
ncbi:MAG TPA: hypothetical protein VLH39_07575, partial [Magnetospirillaceae bacterium]|nr:hypothetical protein [Magnetospirillaceae bacterium]